MAELPERVTTRWRVLIVHRSARLTAAVAGLRPWPSELTDEQCRKLLDWAGYSYWLDARGAGIDAGDMDPDRGGDIQC